MPNALSSPRHLQTQSLLIPVEEPGRCLHLRGVDRKDAEKIIVANHYTHSVPSGKSHVFRFGTAIVMFSIPANQFVSSPLLGRAGVVWELTRLWAPDGHEPNLLTRAISKSVRAFRKIEPSVEALVSYADPNVGHEGYVYRAASWVYLGQSTEGRYYQRREDGQVVARRRFHSGSVSMSAQQIHDAGYDKVQRPGKHRYAIGLTTKARREIESRRVPLEPSHV